MYPNLEAELARRSISKRNLSELTGIRYNTLCEKCLEKYGFTLDEAINIANVLKNPMPIEQLFAKGEKGEQIMQ